MFVGTRCYLWPLGMCYFKTPLTNPVQAGLGACAGVCVQRSGQSFYFGRMLALLVSLVLQCSVALAVCEKVLEFHLS